MGMRAISRAVGYLLVFALSLDRATIPFGTVEPGGFAELVDRNAITVTADTGTMWYLRVAHSGDLPGVALEFRTSGGRGTGTHYWTPIGEYPRIAYTSTMAEGVTGPAGFPVTFSYRMLAAPDAEAGPRAWVVTYTLSATP